MNDVIVLLTHVWNSSIDALYEELKSCKDTIILWDDGKDPPKNREVIKFNKFSSNIAHHTDGKLIFFNDFQPLLSIMEVLEKYDRVWLIESDVRFNGSWKFFFNIVDKYNDNLLIGKFSTFEQDPIWIWYRNAIGYYMKDIQRSIREIDTYYWCHALFCISRLDISLLKMLSVEMPKYSNFFEGLVPTLAKYFGYTIRDLDTLHLLASNYNWSPVNKMTERNKIYHAIKTQHEGNN